MFIQSDQIPPLPNFLLKYSEGLKSKILYENVEAIIVFKLIAIKVH